MLQKFILIAALGAVCGPMAARAQVAELRIGISEFDERGVLATEESSRFRANENSLALSGEVLFEEPEFLKWALSPQPYIGGSLNLEGKTSFGGGGLLWRQSVGKKFYGDFAVGLVAHNGTKEISLSEEGQALLQQANAFENIMDVPDDILVLLDAAFDERFARELEEIEFGSRVLFRLQGAIGVNINKDWSGEVYIEHLSNGFVLDKDVNEGVDILGLRAARKF